MRRSFAGAVSAVVLATASGAALAQEADAVATIPVLEEQAASEAAAGGLSYTYAAGRYLYTDYDDTDVGQNGFGIDGSYLLTPNVYLVGSLFTAETDEFDSAFFGPNTTVKQTQLDLGLGFRQALRQDLDFNVSLRAVQLEVDINGATDDDTGFQFATGLRALVAPAVEVRGEISYVDVFETSDTYLNLSGLYTFAPRLVGGLDFVLGDDSKSYGLTVRYGF